MIFYANGRILARETGLSYVPKINYCIVGKFGGGKEGGKFTFLNIWRGEVWQMDRFSRKVVIRKF